MESLSNLPKVTQLANFRARIQSQTVASEYELFTTAQVLGSFPSLDPSQTEGTCQACLGPSFLLRSILLYGADPALLCTEHTLQLLLQVQILGLLFHF